MRLVNYDLMHERWKSYEVSDTTVTWYGENLKGETLREEDTWRYQYKLGDNVVRGIACICEANGVGRARILRFLRDEAQQQAA